jgi:pyruvate dehydrogenase E2 component (dihydrolipoamide acetyltransferase)
MTIKILMPALSPTMTEGNLAKWLIGEGDEVRAGEAIAEIETDKATMEVEAVDDGILGKILVPDGTEGVAVNEVIAIVLEEGEDASAIDAVSMEPAPVSAPSAESAPAQSPSGELQVTPLARRVAKQMSVDLATVVATGPGGVVTLGDVEKAAGGATSSIPPVSTQSAPTGDQDRIFASPLARRMAAQAGLDLAAIPGSGPNGRIVKSDIDAVQAAAVSAPAIAAPAASVAPPPIPAASAEDQDIKLSTMRRVIAERMVESKSTVPHFYLTVDCEIDELLKIRARLNHQAEPDKISVNDFVIRACGLALREVPEANVSWLGDGMMRQLGSVDISVAVAIDGGLITPIVRNADQKGFLEISREMKDLAARARDGKLMPEEYQGGSFSISNLGMFGVKQFDAIINAPQAAILAVGAGEQRPVVRDGEIVPATVMSCTLSVDHRVVDGAVGARLLAAIKRYIEYPPAMLL